MKDWEIDREAEKRHREQSSSFPGARMQPESLNSIRNHLRSEEVGRQFRASIAATGADYSLPWYIKLVVLVLVLGIVGGGFWVLGKLVTYFLPSAKVW